MFLLTNALFVQADESNGLTEYHIKQQETDIIFVIDFSNSMNANDRNKVALQMLESSIDALYASKVRVGFVAYDDTILGSSPPVSIIDKTARESLKTQINSIKRAGNTDIGLALATAEGFIQQYTIPEGRQGRIILLSDGEPDLTYSKTGRTTQQSIVQMREVAQRVATLGVPIDCIAFGQKFDGETTELVYVASQSGGSMYVAKTPDVLIDIFADVIEKTTFSRLRPISVTIAGGEEQTVELPTKDTFADEANILVVSSTPLQDVTILYSSDQLTYSRSEYYFTCKISDLKNENITLKMVGSPNQEIKIYLALYKDFEMYLNASEQVDKNVPYQYQYYVKDLTNDGIITDQKFYDGFQEQIMVTGLEGDINLNWQKGEGQFERETSISQSGDFEMDFKIYNDYFHAELPKLPVVVKNSAPYGEFPVETRYLKANKQQIFDLNDFFTDVNGDSLEYEMQYLAGPENTNVLLNDNQLTVNLSVRGKTSFILQASDSEGAISEEATITISVEPFLVYYSEIVAVTFLVLLMIFFYFFLIWRKRKVIIPTEKVKEEPEPVEVNLSFSGKLNVYFIKAPDDLEIDPLTFALYQLKEKKVTLGHLLEIMDLPLKSFDPEQISLQAGSDKELILSHNSKCSIMVGSSIICKKLRYAVNFGNKIYITSHDGEYELELHYLSIRS